MARQRLWESAEGSSACWAVQGGGRLGQNGLRQRAAEPRHGLTEGAVL